MTNNAQFPLISIIILNYNGGNLLIRCVDSVLKSNYKNFEIIVVDNASKDGSQNRTKQEFSSIQLIQNKNNLGYCEGNNIGIRNSNGDFLVILNPDTTVEPNWLDELISAHEIFGVGIYQPKHLAIIDPSILLSSGNMIQLFGFGYARGKGTKDTTDCEKIESIGYASGTCIFASRETFNKVGLFDSFLFAYHDDLEFCWRAKLLRIESWYVPKSIIYHEMEGYSFKWSSFKYFLLERNRLYCILTHFSFKTIIKMLPELILIDFSVLLFYTRKGLILEKIKANLSIIKHFKLIQKKYYEIKKNKKIKDEDLVLTFKDEVEIPTWVIEKKQNLLLNKIISRLSKNAKRRILKKKSPQQLQYFFHD